MNAEDILDTVMINSIFEDPRDYLFDENLRVSSNVMEFQCPEIEIKVQNIEIKALIDTGSKISCISEDFYRKNSSCFVNCPKLPLPNLQAVGFNGKKSDKLKVQLYLEFSFNFLTVDLNVIVVPHLIRDCILGIDALCKLEADINIKLNKIFVSQNEKKESLDFVYQNCNENELNTVKNFILNIQEMNIVDEVVLEEDREVNYVPSEEDIRKRIDLTFNLDEQQKSELMMLLIKYRHIFRDCPGRIKDFEYKFKIKDTSPYHKKPYPIPLKFRDRMRKVIDRMLEQDIIEKSDSIYISPLALTLKKNGGIRTNLDARELNERIEDDFVGPETMDEILAQCDGVKFMSSLDLIMSFWQVKLADEYKKYTAFQIFGEVYQFKVMPFGTKVSSAALKRGLIHAFGYLKFLLNYVDDNTCLSRTFEEHLEHLEILFCRCERFNITLNFYKCNFCVEQIEFLGYILTAEGLKIDPKKTEKIKNFPLPNNKKEMLSFLGLLNWCSKFNVEVTELIKPLYDLTHENVKFKITTEHVQIFEKAKDFFVSTVMLKHPQLNKDYNLYADASKIAMGAVLTQFDDDNQERIITCINKVFFWAPIKLLYN